MVYVLIFVALIIFFIGKDAGKLAGLGLLMNILTLVGSLFVGGGMIFLAIAGRFL